MIIEILGTNGANNPEPRTIPAKPAHDGKPARDAMTFYEQKAYAHTGGVFPVEFKINLNSHTEAYPIGKYQLAPSSFKLNRFGQLELDRYGMKLIPYADFADKKAS